MKEPVSFADARSVYSSLQYSFVTVQIVQANVSDVTVIFTLVETINTFGVSTYELIYLGVPVITIGHVRKNAEGSACLAEKYGLNYDLGLIDDLTREKFFSTLKTLIKNPKQLEKMQDKSIGLIDGLGANRVAKLIHSLGIA